MIKWISLIILTKSYIVETVKELPEDDMDVKFPHHSRMSQSSIESCLTNLPLCPVVLPDGASHMLEALVSELPLDLINPPNLTETGGDYLWEGDMVLTPEEEDALVSGTEEQRKGILLAAKQWPRDSDTGYPTIPYRFSKSVTDPDMVRKAMDNIEENTCMRFKLITDGNYNRKYVKITKGTGCWSFVGMTSANGQSLSLGSGCYKEGIILHELGHSMGLFHEQSRRDRDQHIKVIFNNVLAGKEKNFMKENTNYHGVGYDINSIMHYETTAFSKNGKATIMTLDPHKQVHMGNRDYLTFRDKQIINEMYNCSEIWQNTCGNTTVCENEGYMGSNCACVCPPGTNGTTCENVDGDYYWQPKCGGNITESGTFITSPSYPSNYPKNSACMWWVQVADECLRPVLIVKDFTLFNANQNGQCVWDRLEVRTENNTPGEEYCGISLKKDEVIQGENELLIHFTSRLNWRKGFKFLVQFEDNGKCVDCKEEIVNGLVNWKSPNYPSQYPNNFTCTLNINKTKPNWTYIQFKKFKLPKDCSDLLEISTIHDKSRRFCGTRKGFIKLLGTNHDLTFRSNSDSQGNGWHINIIDRHSTCHKVIELSSSSSSGDLTSPRYPKKHPKGQVCEWWIKAPEGSRIQVKVKYLSLATDAYNWKNHRWSEKYYDNYCNRGYIFINEAGDRSYSNSTTEKICGFRAPGTTWTSDGTSLNLLFYGSSYNTKGIYLKYSLV